jgi:hypothetical protein
MGLQSRRFLIAVYYIDSSPTNNMRSHFIFIVLQLFVCVSNGYVKLSFHEQNERHGILMSPAYRSPKSVPEPKLQIEVGHGGQFPRNGDAGGSQR